MSQNSTFNTRLLNVFDDSGRLVRATFIVEPRDGKPTVLFQSQGMRTTAVNARNPEYRVGLEILIGRLGAGGARLDAVHMDTARVHEVLNVPPIDLRGADAHEVRLRISRAQNGNGIRQVRLFFSGLNVPNEHVEEYLAYGTVGGIGGASPEEPEPTVISRTEGGKRVRLSSVAERNPALRATAIALHGACCAACGFSFAKTYGEWGADFVEIHHLQPIAEGARDTDPTKDLVPLCANCHRMIHHRRGVTLTVEELRAKMQPKAAMA